MNATDIVTMVGITGVLGVQLIGPLWLAWREFQADTAPKELSAIKPLAKTEAKATTKATAKAKANAKQHAKAGAKEDARVPTLAPLSCPSCKAPVPLLAKRFPCPHCAANVEPPADYINALASRSKSDASLARAERMWRRSRIVCARPMTFLFTLLLLAWTVAVIVSSYKAFDYGVPGPALALPILIAVVQCFLGFFLISVIGDGRKDLPPLPARGELRVPAALATCAGCAGPFEFEKNRLASTCRYCGAENFRAALAQKVRVHEAKGEGDANVSMMEQIKTHEARRHEMIGFFVIIGSAEVFYAVLLPLGWLAALLDFL